MKSITLEMSLKPFRQTDSDYIREKVLFCFEQWKPLVNHADEISIMLWCGDGSELFDYKGNLDDSFEWAYFIGGANQREADHSAIDPEGLGLHTRNYLYAENPPVMTYRILKEIVKTIKEVGHSLFGNSKKILVGETVDVGPEFAISDFKYNRHNELCTGGAMGKRTMLCAYEKMHADDYHYAAYPNGVPEGEPFGTFFGKQSNIFLSDMGFDYIWFSNGMGFGRETWASTGACFDGKSFDCTNLPSVRKDVLEFWKLFRKECPSFEIRTRGTNMSHGIDYATDGVPLNDIYRTEKNMLPPPNSPWAALDGDFGLELMGYMSRIALLPGKDYLFRYYLHDIWWANSPWYDRYGGQPHDIYLPLAIARIDEEGKMSSPSHLHLLSVDNCFGELPELCAYEPLPHLLKAIKESPDAPSPFVWVYPFEEYSSANSEEEIQKMYSEDWFIRGCINNGFALSSVTSTSLFINHNKELYASSIVVTPVPKADSKFENEILRYEKSGGKVIFYGSAKNVGKAFKEHFGIEISDTGLCGEAEVYENGCKAGTVKINPLICGGEVFEKSTTGSCYIEANGYCLGSEKENSIWLRGVVSCDIRQGSRLPVPHSAKEYIISEQYMLKAAEKFGYSFKIDNQYFTRNPCMMLHRHNGAFIFSVFMPSTTCSVKFKFPLGAPILDGYDTVLEDGNAVYHFPKAERKECRVFVNQKEGVVSCRETAPVSAQYRRTITLEGLQNADIYFLAENYCKNNIDVYSRRVGDYYIDSVPYEAINAGNDTYLKISNFTGSLYFRMPFPQETFKMLNGKEFTKK